MRVTIFGPTGTIGRVLVNEALAAGHEVRAYARSANGLPSNVTAIIGTLADKERVVEAIKGSDAVISTLGVRPNESVDSYVNVMQSLLDAMAATSVKRLVTISGRSVTLPGDKKGLKDGFITAMLKRFGKGVVQSKLREHELLQKTNLDWTIVRAPGLNDKPASGKVRLSVDTPQGMFVSRHDLSRFMLSEAEARAYVRKAPFISN